MPASEQDLFLAQACADDEMLAEVRSMMAHDSLSLSPLRRVSGRSGRGVPEGDAQGAGTPLHDGRCVPGRCSRIPGRRTCLSAGRIAGVIAAARCCDAIKKWLWPRSSVYGVCRPRRIFRLALEP